MIRFWDRLTKGLPPRQIRLPTMYDLNYSCAALQIFESSLLAALKFLMKVFLLPLQLVAKLLIRGRKSVTSYNAFR